MSAGDKTIAARVPAEFRDELDARVDDLTAAGIRYPDGRPADLSYVIRVGLRAYLDGRVSLTGAERPAGLFDPTAPAPSIQGDRTAQAEARRRDGIERADQHADPQWLAEAAAAIRLMAELNREFIIDDVWATVGLRRPHESRAMGAVVVRAKRDGIIAPTDRTRPSNSSNRSPMRVWRSLVYKGPRAP
jgi:hypothetical protein